MTQGDVEPVPYPFGPVHGITLDDNYARVREDRGVVRVRMPYGEPGWLVTRYEDARMVLGDPRFSRATSARRDAPRLTEQHEEGGLIAADPPEHTRLRKLVRGAFAVRRIEAMRSAVAGLARSMVTRMRDGGTSADLVEHLAVPLPLNVFCELFGLPPDQWALFRARSEIALTISSSADEEAVASLMALMQTVRDLIERRRREPADDLISILSAAHDPEGGLGDDVLVEMCAVLLIAGLDTTASQISSMVAVLLEHPEHWERLRRRPEDIPATVEEILRMVPIGVAAAFPRYATEDVTVGDTVIRAGEPALVALGAANRDARHFADPERFWPDRPYNAHIGFGHGVHHCLGAPLARLELQEALRALLDITPGLRAGGDPEWKTGSLTRGARVLPVAW